jgi:hypothetical protein
MQIATSSATSAFLPEVFGVYTDTGIAVPAGQCLAFAEILVVAAALQPAVGMLAAVSIAAAGILVVLVVSDRSAEQAAPGFDQINDSRARAVFETTADF